MFLYLDHYFDLQILKSLIKKLSFAYILNCFYDFRLNVLICFWKKNFFLITKNMYVLNKTSHFSFIRGALLSIVITKKSFEILPNVYVLMSAEQDLLYFRWCKVRNVVRVSPFSDVFGCVCVPRYQIFVISVRPKRKSDSKLKLVCNGISMWSVTV